MAIEPLISWDAPAHLYTEKSADWYWIVGVITLALAAVALMFGEIITALFIVVAVTALVIHASHPPRIIRHEINDRGIVNDGTLYPFLTLDSFWIPHDEFPHKIILKSRKLFSPYIIMYIDEVDPEDVRQTLLKYIAETEHREHFLKHILEWMGF